MSEWKLFDGDVPHVSTAEFHADRPRAPHLEQEFHQERLSVAAEYVIRAARDCGGASVSDRGCGDGGLLSLVQGGDHVLGSWGYDFCPANAAGWKERNVRASALDVFGEDWSEAEIGTVVVMTEVLEHLADPHGVLSRLRDRGAARLVCSSPWNEHVKMHCPEHAWAWNIQGYTDLITGAGWEIREHTMAGLFQVVWAR